MDDRRDYYTLPDLKNCVQSLKQETDFNSEIVWDYRAEGPGNPSPAGTSPQRVMGWCSSQRPALLFMQMRHVWGGCPKLCPFPDPRVAQPALEKLQGVLSTHSDLHDRETTLQAMATVRTGAANACDHLLCAELWAESFAHTVSLTSPIRPICLSVSMLCVTTFHRWKTWGSERISIVQNLSAS